MCASCKTEQPSIKDELIRHGVSPEAATAAKLFKGKGCPTCNNTGYKGRVAIYEVMDVTQALKEMVLRGDSIMDIKKQAIKEGLKTLRMSGLTKVCEGRTTLEEALTSTMET